MRIPPDALIAEGKLRHYLLVPRPKNDKSKFLAQAGFTQEHPEVLDAAIRQLIQSVEAIKDKSDDYGDCYRVAGDLIGTGGRKLAVITFWIRLRADNEFRFVTLIPRREPQ